MSSRRKSLTTSLELDRLSTTPQRRSSISKDDAHADIVSVLPESDDRLETVAFLNEEEADDLPMPAIASTKPTTISRGTVFYIVLNCAATVAVVFLNKITFSDDQLKHCQFSTTTYHFLTTFVLLYLASSPPGPIATWYKPIFAIRWLPIRSILPICILFASFLVLGNFSLTYNSVSFFQLAKILTVPTVVLLNFLLFRKTISLMKMCAVGVACIGVAVATGASVQGNMLGTSIAVASFVCTALYQIYIGKTLGTPIDGKDVSAPQLLMNQTLISSAMLVCLIPFFDRTPNFGQIAPSVSLTWIAGGFVAAIINLTQFLIIGTTSVLTFNVVGIVKTMVTLVLAWWTEGKVVGYSDALGVLLAIGGSFAYAQIRN